MLWILLAAALAILVFYKPSPSVETMTNKDLLATLDKFGKTGTKPKTKQNPYEEAIYGPKAPKIEEPSPASHSSKNSDGSSVYPDIYGPEITPVPGRKNCKENGKETSDCIYEFNPDLQKAFPMEENEPQPFLTDYSKFQH